MRRFSILILLLASAMTLRAASYEAHSPHYSVAIDVVTLGADDVRYDIKITDVVTGAVLASPQLTTKRGGTADEEFHAQGLHMWIHVTEGTRLTANVEFLRGEDTIDAIQATWSTRPKNAVTTTSPGPPYRVGGDVKAPVAITRVEPTYTEIARKARIEGIVIIEAVIDRDGNVTEARILKPLAMGLSDQAIEAVRKWKFKPGTLNGQPVPVYYNLTVNFRLQ